MKARYIIGIDEVGRGALAGPLVVAGVAAPAFLKPKTKKLKKPLKDSKKLRPKERAVWTRYVKTNPFIFYALTRAYPKAIDRLNVSKAANLAAKRAYRKLLTFPKISAKRSQIYLDGGLFLGDKPGSQKLRAKTLVKGDEKINAIKLASIVAKVNRDRYMIHLHRHYKVYGFDVHKGYGTKNHRRVIKKYGPSDVHRLTFLKNHLKI